MAKKLTAKQEMFCKEYIIDFNGTRAAIAAGYSKKTADVIASENLVKPNVMQYLSDIKKERSEKVGLTAEKVLEDISEIKSLAILNEELGHALKACELEGKHIDMWGNKDINVNLNTDIASKILKARNRKNTLLGGDNE